MRGSAASPDTNWPNWWYWPVTLILIGYSA